MGRYAVFGLGKFGVSLATTLYDMGQEVIAVDRRKQRVEDIKDKVSVAIVLESTDEDALKSISLDGVEVAIICFEDNFEASILTTIILKNILKLPKVIVRADSHIQGNALIRIGADSVIYLEEDMGKRLARAIATYAATERFEIMPGYDLIEIDVPDYMVGKNLKELGLRNKYKVNVAFVKKLGAGEDMDIFPNPDYRFQEGDRIWIIGKEKDLRKFLGR